MLEIAGRRRHGLVYKAEDSEAGPPRGAEVSSRRIRKRSERLWSDLSAKRAPLPHWTIPTSAPFYEFGEHEGQPFLVMPLLEGQTLRDRIAEEAPLPTDCTCSTSPFKSPTDWTRRIRRASSIATSSPQISSSPARARPRFSISVWRSLCLRYPSSRRRLRRSGPPGITALEKARERPSRQRAPDFFLSSNRSGHGHGGLHVAGAGTGREVGCAHGLFSFGLVLYEMATGNAHSRVTPGRQLQKAILTADAQLRRGS